MVEGFGIPFVTLRLRRGKTQQELADDLGITRHTIANWESGRTIPKITPGQYKKLLRILQISADELPDNFGPQELLGPSWLKQLRRNAGLTREKLANALSEEGTQISEEVVDAWEERGIPPELSVLQVAVLCESLGISARQLADCFKSDN